MMLAGHEQALFATRDLTNEGLPPMREIRAKINGAAAQRRIDRRLCAAAGGNTSRQPGSQRKSAEGLRDASCECRRPSRRNTADCSGRAEPVQGVRRNANSPCQQGVVGFVLGIVHKRGDLETVVLRR
jgi:hypothetical protein